MRSSQHEYIWQMFIGIEWYTHTHTEARDGGADLRVKYSYLKIENQNTITMAK